MASQRSIWKGAITFGMLSIPVKLYGATIEQDLAFNNLHAECRSRIKQKRWCPVHEREVQAEELVRAYEWSKNDYVDVTDDDLAALPVPSLHTIELAAFVKADEVDRVFAEKSYWLDAEPAGAKPYVLLHKAMSAKGVVGIGKLALRSKERIVCVRAHAQGVLIVETLFWPDEVRSLGTPPAVSVADPELEMANMLVDAFTETFTPSNYRDEYRVQLLERIEAKRQGQAPIALPSAPAAPEPQNDMMAMLRATIEAKKKAKPGAAA